MRRMTSWPTVLAITLTAMSGVVGCASDPREGYSFSSGHGDTVRTVAIEVFDNETFSTGLEAQLSEAVAREIMRTTRWRVASTRNAETILSGRLTASELRPLSSDQQTGLVQELGVRLTVDFDWMDNRSGKTLVSRRSFTAMDTFVPAIRTGERIEIGQASTIDALAKAIVAELRSSW
ncbi:MAG: hypothetical protein KF787_06315 [Phycisphaeraceae bacterium]|nr:hypothetical protein [Phycisphaerae bacterium]MBX3392245.1 hypothetical protein [Phycisphaeraceae bacterium]